VSSACRQEAVNSVADHTIVSHALAAHVFGHDLGARLNEARYEETLKDICFALTEDKGLENSGRVDEITKQAQDLIDELDSLRSTMEAVRVLSKQQRGFPATWLIENYRSFWPQSLQSMAAAVVEGLKNACRHTIYNVVRRKVQLHRAYYNDFKLQIWIRENSDNSWQRYAPMERLPSRSPVPFCVKEAETVFLAGLTELIRNAAGYLCANATRLPLHIDINITAADDRIAVDIWNPYDGNHLPVSGSLTVLKRLIEARSEAIRIEAPVFDPQHSSVDPPAEHILYKRPKFQMPVAPDDLKVVKLQPIRYVKSRFELSPARLTFYKQEE
jgi:hypothetical protein